MSFVALLVTAVVHTAPAVAPRAPLAPLVHRPTRQARLLANARGYEGVPYRLNGRSRRGLDCIGLLFRAYAETYGVRIRDFDRHNASNAEVAALLGHVHRVVMAEELAAAREAVRRELADGDSLFFLWPQANPTEPAFVTVDGRPFWVWHAGFAASDGTVVHAAPGAGVVSESLEAAVRRFDFEGLVIVKPGRGT